MNPPLVDSTQCHLWTDMLHVRQLARDAVNRWDRGTYVRLCIVLAWTALEIACQEALNAPDIGYRFKDNLDRAVASRGLPPIDWSKAVWQEVRLVQELRKSCVHRFMNIEEMFPDSAVADETVSTVRAAIRSIFEHVSGSPPTWIDLDQSMGWAGRSGASDTMFSTLSTGGASPDDPNAVRICFVADGVERVSSVHPCGFDYANEVHRLVSAVRIPISAVRIYKGQELVRELLVNMRGNA